MAVKIRFATDWSETLMPIDFKGSVEVVGHLDEEGWWPAIRTHGFYKFTAADLRSIAACIEGRAALKRSIDPVK